MNSTDAAAQAGVHRNTIANWRRNYLLFRESLADAQYDRALLFRDKAEDRLDLAFETLRRLLNDPKASPSVRLKAAMFIIDKATTPPQPKKQVLFDIPRDSRVHRPTRHHRPDAISCLPRTILHNLPCTTTHQAKPRPKRRRSPLHPKPFAATPPK